MPIQYRCDRCGVWLSISRKKIGERIACPHCAAEKVIPTQDEQRGDAARSVADVGRSTATPVVEELVFQQASEPVPEQTPLSRHGPEDISQPDEIFATWSETGEGRPAEVAVDTRSGPLPEVGPQSAGAAGAVGAGVGTTAGKTEPNRGRSSPASTAEADLPLVEFKRRPRDTEEMDLTPMVDMTFLLLIFFMVTASLQLQKSLEMPAPNPDQTGAQQSVFTPEQLEESCIRVSIDSDNRVLVEDEPVAGPDQILERLKMQMRTTQRYELVVAADPAAFHESVVAVIDAAQAAGMEKIRMIGSPAEF